MKISLNKKILYGFTICTIMLISVAIFSFRNSEKFIDTSNWVNHSHEVLYEFEQILLSSVDAETGVRGFIISGNTDFLEPYHNGKNSIKEHISKVKKY